MMKAAGSVNGQSTGGPSRWYSFPGMTKEATPAREPQSAGAVLMVRPAGFAFNPETAASNAFQAAASAAGPNFTGLPHAAAQELALREFDGLAAALSRAGIEVIVGEDTASPPKPDAVFPNNWVSFHRDGTVVLYPMMAPNRRPERREDLVRQVIRQGGFRTSRTVDLSHREASSQYLEGTGSLVLDRANRVAFACLSPRTDFDVLGEFTQALDYDLATFEAFDAAGRAIYHTNVLLAIGSGFAVICAETIGRPEHRAAVMARLRATGHVPIEISSQQMRCFAGNILELKSPAGAVIAMSATAWDSFEPAQRRILEAQGTVVTAPIPVIEALGGGGVRCMLAEIHLPKHVSPPVP